jgi:hypothetical protein
MSTGHEVRCDLWNRMIHFHVQKNWPLDLILIQMDPVQALTQYYFEINFKTFLKWSLSFSFSIYNFVSISHNLMRAAC